MARPSNRTQRRAEIVAAMMALMSRLGYAKTTTAAIAAQAGLSGGLVHYHFPNKASILVELVEQLGQRLEKRLLARPATRRGLIEGLLGLSADADPAAMACWVQIGAEAHRLPEVQAVYEVAITRLIDRAAGVLGSREDAIGVIAACEGIAHLAIAAPSAVPPGQAVALVERLFT